jgi:hypothetical protein
MPMQEAAHLHKHRLVAILRAKHATATSLHSTCCGNKSYENIMIKLSDK